MEKIIIKKTSEETREAIKRSSSFSLPNNPSDRGMKPDQIRQAFWAPIVGLSASVLVELDRVVDEINAILGSNGTQSFNTEAKDLIGAVNELKKISDAIKDSIKTKLDEHNQAIDSHPAILEQLKNHYEDLQKCFLSIDQINQNLGDGAFIGGLDSLTFTSALNVAIGMLQQLLPRTSAIEQQIGTGDLSTSAKELIPAINETYGVALQGQRQADSNRINLVNLTAQVSGVSRSFTVNSFLDFVDFMRGDIPIAIYEDRDGDGVAELYNLHVSDLKTGDNILIVEKNVPDFWFEKNSSPAVVEEYEYQEEIYSLEALDASGAVCGAMHLLESDYNVILGYATSASIAAKEAQEAKEGAEEALKKFDENIVNAITKTLNSEV